MQVRILDVAERDLEDGYRFSWGCGIEMLEEANAIL